ncbi:unnamed protein product [Cuscuta europaea]|uniref:Uncharacterized protein n=1 Tax=Cuscuta europaea TaxID=41803 RepID=A0A9P0YX09_CUSEU|nr:unnamed protein product [Cuscuta europaea]
MKIAMRVVMKLATVAALLLIGFGTAASGAETKSRVALRGCREKCGNVTVPYPFGIGPGKCSLEGFELTCDKNSRLWYFDTEFTAINLLKGTLEAQLILSSLCYNESGKKGKNNTKSTIHFKVESPFSISREENKLFTVGCNAYGSFSFRSSTSAGEISTGCGVTCDGPPEKKDAWNCTGVGCCQEDIPVLADLMKFSFGVSDFGFRKDVWKFNNCSHSFVAKKGWYHFKPDHLTYLGVQSVPLVVNWGVGEENETCKTAAKERGYACRGLNTDCEDATYRRGYRCKCKPGYDGNPYLRSGCQNVNECNDKTAHDYRCDKNAICEDNPGNYTCLCKKGYEGDGYKGECTPKRSANNALWIICSSVSVGVASLLIVSFFVYWGLRKRRLSKLREHYFHQNGGILLQQQIAGNGGPNDARMKIFTLEDLEKATDNFDEKTILGQGGYGTVYKGVLTDTSVVAIKKSKICEQSQVEQFINEVVVLSQINHRNIVKLFGCCLETEVPLLVYEFITNGTLYEHLHTQARSSNLSWATRLRVASESAGALSYLHSAASPPIIHRDVKTANILLDDRLTAKVGDFGASRLFPLDRTQVTTLVQGTFGYLDPEYFHTGQLTDKSDVYSFGVVLAELLTGEKAISPTRAEDDRNLAAYFVSSLNNGNLSQIVDSRIVNDVNFEQYTEVAKIASRCLKVRRDDRPTMREVAMEIDGLRVLERHRAEGSGENEMSSKVTEYLSASASSHAIHNVGDSFTSGGKTSDGESMDLFSRSLSGGR